MNDSQLVQYGNLKLPGGFAGGLTSSIKGLTLAGTIPGARKMIGFQVLLVGIVSAVLQIGSIYLLWDALELAAPLAVDGWWNTLVEWSAWIARWTLVLVGTLVALIMAPLLVVQMVGMLLPSVAEKLFLTGYGARVNAAALQRYQEREGIGIAESVVRSLRRLVILLVQVSGLALLGVVPVVGVLVQPVSWYLAGRMLGEELLDPWADIWMDRRERKQWIQLNRPWLAGFGLPLTAILAVPIVGPLLYSLAQIGAGVAIAERENQFLQSVDPE